MLGRFIVSFFVFVLLVLLLILFGNWLFFESREKNFFHLAEERRHEEKKKRFRGESFCTLAQPSSSLLKKPFFLLLFFSFFSSFSLSERKKKETKKRLGKEGCWSFLKKKKKFSVFFSRSLCLSVTLSLPALSLGSEEKSTSEETEMFLSSVNLFNEEEGFQLGYLFFFSFFFSLVVERYPFEQRCCGEEEEEEGRWSKGGEREGSDGRKKEKGRAGLPVCLCALIYRSRKEDFSFLLSFSLSLSVVVYEFPFLFRPFTLVAPIIFSRPWSLFSVPSCLFYLLKIPRTHG